MRLIDDDEPTRLREVVAAGAGGDGAPTRVHMPGPARRLALQSLERAPGERERAKQHLDPLPARGAETDVAAIRSANPRGGGARRSPARELALRVGLTLAAAIAVLGLAVFPSTRPAREAAAPSDAPSDAIQTPRAAVPAPSRAEAITPEVPAAAASPGQPSAEFRARVDARAAVDASASPAEASRLLSVGAYAAALEAYRALSHAEPQAPVFAMIAQVLERRIGARCAGARAEGGETCKPKPIQPSAP